MFTDNVLGCDVGIRFYVKKHLGYEKDLFPGVRILFVVYGRIEVSFEDKKVELSSDDVILINQCVSHSVKELENSIVAVVEYSPKLIWNVLKKDNLYFFCSSAQERNRSHADVQELFYSLVYEYTYNTHESSSYLISILMKLLDVLVERYLLKEAAVSVFSDAENEKIHRLILYVNSNYQYDINLTDLADEYYASASTLSRLFKKNTGVYFADYVKSVRCKFAAAELIETDWNVTKISGDCGFSNPSVFNKSFKEIYGCTPLEYRTSMRNGGKDDDSEESKSEQIKEEIKKSNIFSDLEFGKMNVAINMKTATRERIEGVWKKIINIGSFNNMTMANVQQHALFLHEHLGFEYVRMWSVFSKKMMFTDGKAGSKYNYDKIDQVLDFLSQSGIKPFIDFGCKPNAILNSNKSIFYEDEYIVFESKELWELAVKDFFTHVCRRYGKSNVEKWIVEVSYDKRHFSRSRYYESNDYTYFGLYQYIYNTAKKMVPGIKVCAYSSIINEDENDFIEFAINSRSNKCIPDYFTFIMLPYEIEGEKNLRMNPDRYFERNQLKKIRNVMAKCGVGDSKIILSELNNSISNRNYLNDSCWRAAFMVRKITSLWKEVDGISVLMGTDWISSFYDSIGVVTGSIGLISKNTIRKPAYFALKFLNLLSENLIYQNENVVVTKKDNGGFYILCNNYKHFNTNYFSSSEDVAISKSMCRVFEDTENLSLNIFIENIENGNYVIKKRTVNSQHGSILNEWEKLQYSTDLNSSDMNYLNSVCVPQMVLEKMKVSENNIMVSINMEYNEVSLIHIYME